jgi:translation initiation factor 1 (eIF-1/SUI1)
MENSNNKDKHASTSAPKKQKKSAVSATPNFSDLVPAHQAVEIDNNHAHVLLGQKIMISVHKGKNTVTKVEGIPTQFCLTKLLKTLKAKDMLSCGGHVATDKETKSEFLVLQGSVSAEVGEFLIREGLADADCIIYRG